VNARTLSDLDIATTLAAEVGAAEFLLLPEQPAWGRGGIDGHTIRALRRWVSLYQGVVPLTVSEAGAEGLPICDPLLGETGLRAYAHIDQATRPLYWFGRGDSAALFDLTLDALAINDPYVSERLLAASYGIVMAHQLPELEFARVLHTFLTGLRSALTGP